MHENNTSSGVNTILIVVVLLILVGFGVWWFTTSGRGTDTDLNSDNTPSDNSGTINLDVMLPGDSNNGTTTQ